MESKTFFLLNDCCVTLTENFVEKQKKRETVSFCNSDVTNQL